MTTIKLESLKRDEKTITLLPYTRKMERLINEEMMKWVTVKSNGYTNDTEVPALNTSRAEQLAVVLVSGLTNDEVDDLIAEDYAKLKRAVDEATKPETIEKKIEKSQDK